MTINWSNKEMVVFDLDGTLYDQKRLRQAMLIEMVMHYFFIPWRWSEVLILFLFRRNREKLSHNFISGVKTKQYILKGYQDNPEKVERIVNEWIRIRPLKHLHKYVYSEALAFVKILHSYKIKTMVLSDYNAEEKILALGIPIEESISSESLKINILKPHPAGMQYILKENQIERQKVVYIGDRVETDFVAAQKAGIDCIILRKQDPKKHYSQILKELNEEYGLLDM